MLHIPKHMCDEMIQHAREHDPHECCGILAGTDGQITEHYRITNVLATMSDGELERFEGAKLSDLQELSPEERADIAFQMDAREMSLAQKDIRNKGIQLQAFYHSHTCSPARPSVTDIKIAMEFESYREKLNIPEPFHLIISLQDKENPYMRAFRIQHSQATEIDLNVHLSLPADTHQHKPSV